MPDEIRICVDCGCKHERPIAERCVACGYAHHKREYNRRRRRGEPRQRKPPSPEITQRAIEACTLWTLEDVKLAVELRNANGNHPRSWPEVWRLVAEDGRGSSDSLRNRCKAWLKGAYVPEKTGVRLSEERAWERRELEALEEWIPPRLRAQAWM